MLPTPTNRRCFLNTASLGGMGLFWQSALGRIAAGAGASTNGTAKSVILIFNCGAPSHIDLWDLKPKATDTVRGPYKPIATTVPGLEEGLAVTIRPGGKGVRVVPDVASGAVAFGVDNADKLVTWRAQQADAVAVMSPIQISPRCIMVHKSSGLKKLEDLATKRPLTLAINADQPFALYLKKRVDLTDVQIVSYSGINRFLELPDYGMQAYNFSEPFLAEQKGGDPECLMLSDLGFNTYTSMLIARREMIDKQPELVAKMTRASIRGWQKYLADPEETNKHIHAQNPEMGLDVLKFGVAALRPLCLPEEFAKARLGEMTAERWQTLVEQMVEIGSIKAGAVVAADAFTLQFVSGKKSE